MTATGRAHPSLGPAEPRGRHLEPELVIEHREALIFLLYQAAEIEHGAMCQYLYAAFTLRRSDDPAVAPAHREAIGRWRAVLNEVAAEEMLHLALVSNLLTAVGVAPNFGRPQFPMPAHHFPPGMHMALLPFSEPALRHFLYLERPEGSGLEDSIGDEDLTAALRHAVPAMSPRDVVPRTQQFETVGHLYRAIARGVDHLCDTLGEDGLFVGPERAQAGPADFRLTGLRTITDLSSARAALELIVDQGEGAQGAWRTSHFGRFSDVLAEYLAMRESEPELDPVRPVLVADVRPHENGEAGELIGDPVTARVVDLFNVGYEVMLQALARYFSHTEETADELSALADVALGLMVDVMSPLGDLICDLPVGPDHPGRTAGPSFELFYTSGYLIPDRDAAWRLLCERLRLAASLAAEIPIPGDELGGVGATFARLAERLDAAERSAADDEAADEPHILITEHGPYVVSGALALDRQAIGTDGDGNSIDYVARDGYEPGDRYALCRCGQSQNKPFCDGSHAHVGFDGTETASRARFVDDAEVTDGPTMRLHDDRPLCAFARFCDTEGGIWKLTPETDDPHKHDVVAHQATHCPSGRLVVHDKHADEVLEPELEPSIVLLEDPQQDASGPIWVRGAVRITSADGFVHERRNRVTLCRCGQSQNKPFCDGTHAHIGFRAD